MRTARGDDDGYAAPKQGLGEVGARTVRELEVENGKLGRMVLKPSESLNRRPKRPGDPDAAILQSGFQSQRDQRLILGPANCLEIQRPLGCFFFGRATAAGLEPATLSFEG